MLTWGGKNQSLKDSLFFNCEVIFSLFKAHFVALPPLRSKLHLVSLSYAPLTSSMLSLNRLKSLCYQKLCTFFETSLGLNLWYTHGLWRPYLRNLESNYPQSCMPNVITYSKGRRGHFSWSFFHHMARPFICPSIRPIIHPWMASYREENPGINK